MVMTIVMLLVMMMMMMMMMMMVMNTLHKMTMPMILKIVLFNFVKMTC